MKNTKKGFGVVVPIIIIAVVVIVAIIAYNSNKRTDTVSTIPQEEQSTEVTPATETSPTAKPSTKSPVTSTTNSTKNQPQTTTQCTNQFLVVDSATGIVISNPSFSLNGKKFSGTSAFLTYLKTQPKGQYITDVSATGYKLLSAARVVNPQNNGLIIELDPVTKPSNGPAYVKNKVRIFGYVIDTCGHTPISGVSVSIPNYGTSTTSATGFYSFDVDPKIAGESCDGFTAVFKKTGYVESIITRFGSGELELNPQGPSLFQHNIELKQGNGSGTTDEKHALCQ